MKPGMILRAVGCAALLPTAWLLSACSDDSESRNSTAPGITPLPAAGCEQESFRACDIQSDACQAAVFSAVTCLRGNAGATRPTSRTLTASQWGAELAADAEQVDPQVNAAYEKCAVMLHLANPGDLSLENQVAVSTSTIPASYSPKTKRITFVSPEGEAAKYRQESAYVTLAHEYVHALQDQEHDLTAFEDAHTDSTDSALAVRSVVEGEAILHEDRFFAGTWGMDPSTLDWDARYAAMRSYDAQALADVAPILAIWRSFPYDVGGPYLKQTFDAGGMAAVRALFVDPPTAAATVLSGVEPIDVVEDPPAPPDGLQLFNVDTLGSQLLFDFLSSVTAISTTDANGLAADWRGDRLYLYLDPTSSNVALIWRLRFATTTLRDRMLAATNPWQSTAIENDALIGLSSDPDVTAAASVITTLLDNAKNGIVISTSSSSDEPAQAAGLRHLLRIVR